MNRRIVAQTQQVDPNSMASKRRTPRRLFQRPLGVLVRGHYMVVAAKQLSEGGLLFEIPRTSEHLDDLRVGTALALSILLPVGAGLVLRGRVIYHAEEKSDVIGVGVKFDEILLNQRRLIRNYVSSKPVGE